MTANPSPDHRHSEEGVLGRIVQHSLDRVETLEIGETPSYVEAVCSEVDALCPVTHQPDHYVVTIGYPPAGGHIVESKSLKLFLWRYRDWGISCEALAVDIARNLSESYAQQAGEAVPFTVHVTQQSRGGIVLKAEAKA